jgi:tRNA-specific 2-thiouridylase
MKAVVLLSGGVDSSVALAMVKQMGWDAEAYYLKIWLEDDMAFMGDCPWEEDLYYAREVCKKLDVPLKIINMQREYFNTVVEYSITELKAGRTPSPDIMCNKNIKFGLFFDKLETSFDKCVSGHYAKCIESDGKFLLYQAEDKFKDQTYFLTYLNQSQLSRIYFPLGDFQKAEVREKATAFGLPTAVRKDSQGICFLGKIKYNDFVKFHLGEKKGNIIELESGKKLGEHNGFWFHTIGQRQGLGLSGGPWYVVRKDIDENIIYVSHSEDLLNKPCNEYFVSDINWINEPPAKLNLTTKLRHGPKKIDCHLEFQSDNLLKVKLEQQDAGISPGQFSIFYDDTLCLGGGIISGIV